jgi:transcriptional regulator with XRE-family HTH domain
VKFVIIFVNYSKRRFVCICKLNGWVVNFLEMRTRLQQLMDKEGISPARFAEIVGVQRSSVSHILSGRNNPSLEFIQKILTAFPKINSDWLIIGVGAMYRATAMKQSGIGEPESAKSAHRDLFAGLKEEDPAPYHTLLKTKDNKREEPVTEKEYQPTSALQQPSGSAQPVTGGKTIEQIVVFYQDGTFKIYLPEKSDSASR